MPVIAVNLSDKLIQDIKGLVEKGLYESLESFVEIGCINQLALERGSTPTAIIEKGHRLAAEQQWKTAGKSPAPPNASATATATAKPSTKKRPVAGEKVVKLVAADPVTTDEAAVMFKRLAKPLLETIPTPWPMPKVPKPGDRIFGQVNRLFPVKFVCRWLANNASVERQWPKFTVVSSAIADDAGTLGSLLDQWDQKQDRERGGEMATALPRRKNNASLDRFLSQFIARITRSSDIAPGAVCQYGLARFEDACIALTEQGAEFAKLDNSILDAHDEAATATLADPEAEFLISHIRRWVPTEWADMRTVLLAVQSGKATPTDVGETVRRELPENWSESMVQTHISGVIARLGDIRLLRRTWQGRNVRYDLGDTVANFLES
jgi:hypothetical protein